ncbi:LysR family transcriptional regulator [Kiloniella sp.]|uniref:LysR family transcriptional regulator n=1 Tax=Kiloniella sp. TaxID=1938587 RepID=UPI003B01FDDE
MLPALNLELIRTFLTVLKEGGFKAGAERLNKTPAAISMQIKRLEEQLNQRLLERSNKGIVLTAAGEVLKEKGERLLSLNYEILGDMRHEELSGRLSFGAPTDYAPTLLKKIMPIFVVEFPKVDPKIILEPSRNLRRRVQSGALDMAIVAREPNTDEGDHLWTEEVAWYGNASDLVGGLNIGVLGVDCILRDRALEMIKAVQSPYTISLESASVASLFEGVEAGFCQAFLPVSVAESELRSSALNSTETMKLEFALIFGKRFEKLDTSDLTARIKRALE